MFKQIQWDLWRFLKDNKHTNQPKVKKKPKTKPSPVKATLPPNHFEPTYSGNLDNTYRHRVGRLNDWDETYGQGMYED